MGTSKKPPTGESTYRYLWEQFKLRTLDPLKDFTFVAYLIGAVVILGGLGIWMEVFKLIFVGTTDKGLALFTSLLTYSPAMIGAACFQLVLQSIDRKDKVISAFAFISIIVSIIYSIVANFLYAKYPGFMIASMVWAVIAVWFWIFTNADDDTFRSSPIDAPSGGSLDKELLGSTAGFVE